MTNPKFSITRSGKVIELSFDEIVNCWAQYQRWAYRNIISDYCKAKRIEVTSRQLDKATDYYAEARGETEDWTYTTEWAVRQVLNEQI